MKLISHVLNGLIVLISTAGNAQGIEKTYRGQWGSSFWTFEFHEDKTYKRTSGGHYGNTIVEGKYRIYNDTLEIINGFENSSGTINRYYVMDGDRIIDLTLLYDYTIAEGFPISYKNKRVRVKNKEGGKVEYHYVPESLLTK